MEDSIADFSRGEYYDAFSGDEATLSEAQKLGLLNEVAGTIARIDDYYLPMIRPLAQLCDDYRVLDSGCGNGISVDLLNDAEIETWGNDISALRKWQWRERKHRDKLLVADTRRLPFPDKFFNIVLSSGVLEHVGVSETGGEHYSVEPLPDRDEARVGFLRELLRVVRDDGMLVLDFPNGSFPIDFWHGPKPGGARFHSLKEGFLPTVSDVRRYVESIGDYSVRGMSPAGRLRMRQVGQHWYGQLLRLPMRLALQIMSIHAFRALSESPLNPYLVLTVRRETENA